jgi:prolyl 4-hydroxylase
VRPKTGLAVIWNNLYPVGRTNYDTLHHGTPVKAGYKAIITKWFRHPRAGVTG